MPDPLVAAAALSYRYPGAGSESLVAIDLRVEPGEFVVVAGRSGSGKSTLLHACCGLVPHYHGGAVSGALRVAGRDVADHGPADLGGEVGLVAQDPESQVVGATVRGEIELPLEIRGDPVTARARAVEEVALALGIAGLLGRATDTLSGGELQRVALAAALVGRPRLVLLDEPTSQLDPVAGDELIGLLRRLNEEWGTAVILAEHRLERCLAAADRAVALAGGSIAFDGAPEEFLAWAMEHDRELATPGAQLFDAAGLEPLPASVKGARGTLRARGLEPAPQNAAPAPAPEVGGRLRRSLFGARKGTAGSLDAADVWLELDDGSSLRDVLRGITLRIEPGERVALMGRNGAGKSTLMRAAAGLVTPARGRLAAPGDCALLSQSPADFLAREVVSEELPGPQGAAALEAVGLAWAAESDPRDLSGGERQRLALAIVMAGRGIGGAAPALVCLDEPTRGMDRARKHELAERLDSLASSGSAVLLATHDVEFAAEFARRVVLLGDGEVIADGPAEDVLAGGWYFATEVARILGAGAPISPQEGAELLRRELDAAGPGTPGRTAEQVPEPSPAGLGTPGRIPAEPESPLRWEEVPEL